MSGDVEMDECSAAVVDEQEDVEGAEGEGVDCEEVAGPDLGSVVLKESALV